MFGSEILDVVIGLIFIFLLLSLLCSAVKEAFEAWMKKRATNLEKGIRVLLNDPDGKTLANKLYNHPLVYGLFHGEYEPGRIKNGYYSRGSNLPSYIPSRTFALALMDIISSTTPVAPAAGVSNTSGGSANPSPADAAPVINPNPLKPFLEAIKKEEFGNIRQALMALANAAENDMGKLRENIEAWYDAAMERVSGWYKRNNQKVLLFIAFAITIGMNVNTIDIANHLIRDKALRDSLVAQAGVIANDPNWREAGFQEIETRIHDIGLPIGWSQVRWGCPKGAETTASQAQRKSPGCAEKAAGIVWNCFLSKLFGWGITAFAISLGAPFWFDLLNKFIKIRSTIKSDKPGSK